MPVKLQKRDIKHHTCVLYECTSLYYASQLLNCSLIIFSWYFTCNKTEIWTSFKMSMSRMLPIKDFQENMHGKHLYQSSHRYQSSMDDMFKCPSVCVCAYEYMRVFKSFILIHVFTLSTGHTARRYKRERGRMQAHEWMKEYLFTPLPLLCLICMSLTFLSCC